MADDWRRFAALFAGVLLLLGGVVGAVATVEHDRHCRLEEVRDSPRGESVEYYYSELTDEQQRLFDRMRANADRQLADEACFGGTVRHEDRYYDVELRRTIVWTNPRMLVALTGFVGGVGLVGTVAWREMKSHPW